MRRVGVKKRKHASKLQLFLDFCRFLKLCGFISKDMYAIQITVNSHFITLLEITRNGLHRAQYGNLEIFIHITYYIILMFYDPL